MTLTKATAITITFVADGSAVSWSAGDVQVSQDGGAFVNAANLPVSVGFTGVYSLDLTSAELDCDWLHVKVTNGAISDIHERYATSQEITGVVVADGGNLAHTFETDLPSGVDNFYVDKLLQFTDGALAGQVKQVAQFAASSGFISVSEAFTGVPATGTRFRLL